MNPFAERRLHIKSVSNLCNEVIEPNSKIKTLAENIAENSNAKNKDSLHLAAAVYINAIIL